mgnify:CR=1 FL=1
MALPNNRRIFDMAAQAWKQSKTILSGPLESPLNPYERLKSLAIQVDDRPRVTRRWKPDWSGHGVVWMCARKGC